MTKIAHISPLAPSVIHDLPVVAGVRYAAAKAGIKYKDRLDVMLMQFAPGSILAGVFTKSATRSAAVLHSQDILGMEGDKGVAILVNSGNSNAFTGRVGFETVQNCVEAVSSRLDLSPNAVHMAQTGVIGEPLEADRIVAVMDTLVRELAADQALAAAKAIMTTDTFIKTAQARITLDGVDVTITGFAKGSGMVAPDMATMLAFVATDVAISQKLLQKALKKTVKTSFNAITVDGDTSTSDSLYLGATCQAKMDLIDDKSDPRYHQFILALERVLDDLAIQVVRDGEGASKLVEIIVNGAASSKSARKIAMSVANSPLVKTAVAGEDPNWGRIVAAVGKAGEPADRDRLAIYIGSQCVARDGARCPEYVESDAAQYLKGDHIKIAIDIGLGLGSFSAWTCDFTKRYIEINADYRS